MDESGGAGGTFEEWIAAWFLLNLLAGESLAGEPLTEVGLQTGLPLDDIGLVFESGRRVAVSVKDGTYLSSRGLPPDAFVERCWTLLARSDPTEFDRRTAGMWLVVREMGHQAWTLWRDLEEAARHGDAAHLGRVVRDGREAMRALHERLQAPAALGLGAAGDAWEVLSRLHVEVRDVGRDHGRDQDRVVEIARGLVVDRDRDAAKRLWHELMICAQERHLGSRFTRASLLERLVALRLAVLPDHRPLMKRIADWHMTDFGLCTKIDGVHVTRSGALRVVREALAADRRVAVEGPSGTGKTVLLTSATAADLGGTSLLRIAAPRVAGLDAEGGLSTFLAALREDPEEHPILVIDGVDLVPDAWVGSIARVARELSDATSRWRVVVVCARPRWVSVEPLLSRANACPGQVVSLGPFEPGEVDEVLRHQPTLQGLAARPELFRLFADPWSLARIVDIEHQGSSEDHLAGTASVGDAWWNSVLEPADPTGAARSAAVEVARRLADERKSALGTGELVASVRAMLGPLATMDVVRTGARVEFAHDRFADVARSQWLAAQGVDEWKARTPSIRWRPALVLAAQRWLERDPRRWSAVARALRADSSEDQDLLQLLVEALWASVDLSVALDRVSSVLIERRDVLRAFSRLLWETARKSTNADRVLWTQGWWAPAWRAMAGWLARHAPAVLGRRHGELLRVVAFLARFRRRLGVPSDDLRVLASTVIQFVDDALRDLTERQRIGRRFEMPEVHEALLELAPFAPERAAAIIRLLAGRTSMPAVAVAEEDEEEELPRTASARLVSMGPVRDAPAEPWPQGPVDEPVDGFDEVAWSPTGALALARFDPALCVEVLLAVVIEPPMSRESWWLRSHRGFLRGRPGLSFPATRGNQASATLRCLFVAEPGVAASVAVGLIGFAAKAEHQYASETRDPTEVVTLDLGSATQRQYFGGNNGWSQAFTARADPGDLVDGAVVALRDALAGELQPAVRAAIHDLLVGCPSTTALGLLAQEVDRDPVLLDGRLEALVSRADLLSWSLQTAAWELLMPSPSPSRRDARYMVGPLAVAATGRWFARNQQWPALDAATAGWRQRVEAGAVEPSEVPWIRKLASWFDAARWTPTDDGAMEWSPSSVEEDAGRHASEAFAAFASRLVAPMVTRGRVDELFAGRSHVSPDGAAALIVQVGGLDGADPVAATTRAKVATVILRVPPPSDGAGADPWRQAGRFIEQEVRDAGRRPTSIRYPQTEVVGAGAAAWFLSEPSDPDARRVAALAAACPDPSLALSFYDELTVSPHGQRPGLRALLHASAREAARHHRTATWFAIGDELAEQHAEERLRDALAFAEGALPDLPDPSFPSGVELEGPALGLLHAMTHWTRTAASEAALRRTLCRGIDRVLRDQIAVALAFHGSPTERERPAVSDDGPHHLAQELLSTLGAYLVRTGTNEMEVVGGEWLRDDRIPPQWVAGFLDALLGAVLEAPDGTTLVQVWSGLADRALDVEDWCVVGGGLVRDLSQVTLGVSSGGDIAEARWTAARGATLDALEAHQERWVEVSKDQDHHLHHLLTLALTPAAGGRRSRFARWIASFAPAARRVPHRAEMLASFLAAWVTDASFDPRDGVAESLLADLRAVGHPYVPLLEHALLGLVP